MRIGRRGEKVMALQGDSVSALALTGAAKGGFSLGALSRLGCLDGTKVLFRSLLERVGLVRAMDAWGKRVCKGHADSVFCAAATGCGLIGRTTGRLDRRWLVSRALL